MERGRIDWPTVCAVAAVAGVVSTQLHEAVGHGGACLALGRRVTAWGAFYVDCDTHAAPLWIARAVAAAGSTMNLVAALVALAALNATPASRPRARLFAWLMFALNGFEWAGYFLFSGVSGLGDWGAGREQVFDRVPGWPLWRALLAAGGAGLYWAWTVWAMRRLARLTGTDDAGRRTARRLCGAAYGTIGAVALAIGLMNPVGLYVLLASAVASSFGGPSGLLWGPRYLRPGPAAAEPFVAPRSWPWIAAAAALVLAEGAVLGRSLRF